MLFLHSPIVVVLLESKRNLTAQPVRVTHTAPWINPFAPNTLRISEASAGVSCEVSIAYFDGLFATHVFCASTHWGGSVVDQCKGARGKRPSQVEHGVFQPV